MTDAHEATRSVLLMTLNALRTGPRAADLTAESADPAVQATIRSVFAITGPPRPVPDVPMLSPFSMLTRAPQALYTVPAPLAPVPQFPDPSPVVRDDWRSALEADAAHFPDPTVDQLLFLLEKHAWSVATPEPGISLWDYARLASGLAGCLASGADRLRLVGADIPGIQRFIYTISSKGALKSLRARSIFLELLPYEVSRRFLLRAGLTRANLVYLSGGHFYILAPDSPETRELEAAVAAEVNRWLQERYGDQLYLALAGAGDLSPTLFAPGAGAGAQVWRQMGEQIQAAKGDHYRSRAVQPDTWDPLPLKRSSCDVCQSETDDLTRLGDDEDGPEACPRCAAFFRFGGEVVKRPALAINPPGRRPFDLEVAGAWYRPVERPDPSAEANLAISDLNAVTYVTPNTSTYWQTNWTYLIQGEVASFADLASLSAGADRLGLLRMDVDDLGQLFRQGLQDRYRDFPRLAGLSHALTRFFKLHLLSVCAADPALQPLFVGPPRPRGRPVTMIYAGGDDLVAAGAWSDIQELAFDIRRIFGRYAGPYPTLSAATVIAGDTAPIHLLASASEEVQRGAKGLPGKNAIALMAAEGRASSGAEGRDWCESTFPWAVAEELLGSFLQAGLDGPGTTYLPRRFVRRLLDLTYVWEGHGPLYLPKLAYAIARLDRSVKEQAGWTSVQKLLLQGSTHVRQPMKYLRPFVEWLDLLTRQEGGNRNGESPT